MFILIDTRKKKVGLANLKGLNFIKLGLANLKGLNFRKLFKQEMKLSKFLWQAKHELGTIDNCENTIKCFAYNMF